MPTCALAADRYARVLKDLATAPDAPLSIDVRIPFCAMGCLYCDCDLAPMRDGADVERYLAALETEIAAVAEHLGPGREVLQVHFGGGSPNDLEDGQLARAMRALASSFKLLGETEVSIDCDPRRTSADQLLGMRRLGFRRVTFGFAALQPEVQRAVGRPESAALLASRCTAAVAAGFESVEVELVLGLPDQTAAGVRATVETIAAIGPDRVSCREYRPRPWLRPHQHAIDARRLPAEDERRALFRVYAETLLDIGYTWVGHDEFALDTDELSIAQSERRLRRNALGCTASPATELVGFGCGAAGDAKGAVVRNERTRDAWLYALAGGRLPVASVHRWSPHELNCRRAADHLACNLELPAELAAGGLEEGYRRLSRRADDGLVEVRGDRLAITRRGRFALDLLLADLGAHIGTGAEDVSGTP